MLDLLTLIGKLKRKLDDDLNDLVKEIERKKIEIQNLEDSVLSIEDKVERMVSKALDFYDKSKVIPLIIRGTEAQPQLQMQMVILDIGIVKQPAGYFKIYHDFAQVAEKESLPLEIIVVSYSEERALRLVEEFNKVNA